MQLEVNLIIVGRSAGPERHDLDALGLPLIPGAYRIDLNIEDPLTDTWKSVIAQAVCNCLPHIAVHRGLKCDACIVKRFSGLIDHAPFDGVAALCRDQRCKRKK